MYVLTYVIDLSLTYVCFLIWKSAYYDCWFNQIFGNQNSLSIVSYIQSLCSDVLIPWKLTHNFRNAWLTISYCDNTAVFAMQTFTISNGKSYSSNTKTKGSIDNSLWSFYKFSDALGTYFIIRYTYYLFVSVVTINT